MPCLMQPEVLGCARFYQACFQLFEVNAGEQLPVIAPWLPMGHGASLPGRYMAGNRL